MRKLLASALLVPAMAFGAEKPKPTKLQTAVEISGLVVSGLLDARSTNELKTRFTGPGLRFTENNPLVRPFVGSKSIYVAIPVADLAVYAGLRYVLHKPRAAKWFLRGEVADHAVCAWTNDRQKPISEHWGMK